MLSGYPLHAVGMELDAIAAVVIGGTLLTGGSGYLLGTVLGVLVLGMIQTLISFEGTLSSWWTQDRHRGCCCSPSSCSSAPCSPACGAQRRRTRALVGGRPAASHGRDRLARLRCRARRNGRGALHADERMRARSRAHSVRCDAAKAEGSNDRNGELSDIVLGFPTLDGYITHARSYFGGTVGRYANRIAQGRFALDGIEYNLSRNDGEHSLHGGSTGFSQRVWRAAIEPPRAVAFSYTSPSGEMGYAGTLEVEVRYTLCDDSLRIDYRASTDAPTIINLTNHALWNLAGEGSGAVDGHVLTLAANHYTPVDDTLIPTGELAPVTGTPFDFTAPRRIGDPLESAHPQLLVARGYDHNFVSPKAAGRCSNSRRGSPSRRAAAFSRSSPRSPACRSTRETSSMEAPSA